MKEHTSYQEWWVNILPFISAHLSDSADTVRALTLDILSHIPCACFQSLSDRQRCSIFSIVLGMLTDTEPGVRAAACGVVGIFITFDCIKEVCFSLQYFI